MDTSAIASGLPIASRCRRSCRCRRRRRGPRDQALQVPLVDLRGLRCGLRPDGVPPGFGIRGAFQMLFECHGESLGPSEGLILRLNPEKEIANLLESVFAQRHSTEL